ncbi:hypothetical protein PIB30_020501 [Stylosanthes scabra]|uniref:Uncharacterized protein n=1 Tax=Stylosanthes scabra TaxID=79078 RepID=A0ABU6X5Z6_9FABA|nr:hypothetical protein [Stylosanthes scabra]
MAVLIQHPISNQHSLSSFATSKNLVSSTSIIFRYKSSSTRWNGKVEIKHGKDDKSKPGIWERSQYHHRRHISSETQPSITPDHEALITPPLTSLAPILTKRSFTMGADRSLARSR